MSCVSENAIQIWQRTMTRIQLGGALLGHFNRTWEPSNEERIDPRGNATQGGY